MDLNVRRRIRKPITIVSDSLADLYRHDLNMFTEAPMNEMSLSEFETVALERLQLFRIIEQAGLKGHKLYSEDWKSCVKEDLTKAGLKGFARLLSGSVGSSDLHYQARRLDHISHFIVRIAYCRSEDLRRYFLNRELEWFRLKFSCQSLESIKHFFEINKLDYVPISSDEKAQLRKDLLDSTAGFFSFEASEFYKVSFTEVCALVKGRRVFLLNGFAYVPSHELIVSIISKFRADLSAALAHYNRRLPQLDDERINPLLANLHNLHTGQNYYKPRDDKESIDPAALDSMSKKHFPFCMRHLHEVLRSEHHLKHAGRLTYGLFLKGIGLMYEDAMAFWREEFTKKIDGNKFEKDYAYNIKHSYGKVGRMLNYSAYSCMKIISGSVGPGEHHGCPFKHWDASVIRQKILDSGVSEEQANDIRDLVKNGHYQVACGKYFEYTHGKPAVNGINHPNQYFEESVDLEKQAIESKK